MTDLVWYLLIGLLVSVLTYALWLPQHKKHKKSWLLKQLQSDSGDKQALLAALDKTNQSTQPKHLSLLLMVLLITPVALGIQSVWFNNQTPQITTPQNAGTQPPDLATAIKQLEAKLAENPDDIQGQLLYAQSMVAMKRYEQAVTAYQKANQLQPNDAAILTEWAEALAFKNNTGSFLGQPSELLAQAIEINPKHQKAMWLYGIVLYEQQQFEPAEAMWTELYGLVSSPGVQSTLLKQINQAREAQGKAVLSSLNDETSNESRSTATLYSVNIQLEGDLDSDNATLFVFAKSTDGMPMPVAAQKITGPFTWPITVALNDSHNLQKERLLSQFDTVLISALISPTGAIEDKSWQSEVITTAQGKNTQLILKRQQP